MISACGVVCSECPAFIGRTSGDGYRKIAADAWQRIYGLNETAQHISCGGCLGSDDDLFHTSRNCRARRCSLANGFANCGECPTEPCRDLEAAQSVWDGVPELAAELTAEDFATWARPYCGHRERIAGMRARRIQD